MASPKKKILLFTDWFEPGFKAGGPITSCRNLVKALQSHYTFFIVTGDRDLGDDRPYAGIKSNTWLQANDVSIIYVSPDRQQLSFFRQLIGYIRPDVLYLNSLFSTRFSVRPLLAAKAQRFAGRVVLAPRGMLHEGALSQKTFKKKIFLWMASRMSLFTPVVFHATDLHEKQLIEQRFGPGTSTVVAANIPDHCRKAISRREKTAGSLRVAFASRIHPHKNLLFALEVLQQVTAHCSITFDIFGDASDPAYQVRCQNAAAALPESVSVDFKGGVPHHEVSEILTRYHLFFLPTLGENFGHAIFEALSAGCPVLISDRTPWSAVGVAGAGWALSLSDRAAFKEAIELLCQQHQQAYDHLSDATLSFANDFRNNQHFEEQYTYLFG